MTRWDYKDEKIEIIFAPPRYGTPHKATVIAHSGEQIKLERGFKVWYAVDDNKIICSSEDPSELAFTWFDNLQSNKRKGE